MKRRWTHPVPVLLAAFVAGTVLFIGCVGEDEFRAANKAARCVPGPGRDCSSADQFAPPNEPMSDLPGSNQGDGAMSSDGAASNDGAMSNDGAASNDGPTSNDASDDAPMSNGFFFTEPFPDDTEPFPADATPDQDF